MAIAVEHEVWLCRLELWLCYLTFKGLIISATHLDNNLCIIILRKTGQYPYCIREDKPGCFGGFWNENMRLGVNKDKIKDQQK